MFRTKLTNAIRSSMKMTPHYLMLAVLISPAYAANDATDQDGSYTFNTVVVKGTKQTISTNVAQSTLRSETDLSTVPRSVQVINTKVIEQQNIQNLGEALNNVSNISEGNSFAGTRDQFQIRGFDANVFKDGTRVLGLAQDNAVIEDIEFIEVVKGPESVLYGNTNPGGLINMITKRPETDNKNSIGISLDQYGQKRLSMDSTGSLNENDSVLYRFISIFDESEGWRDDTDSKQVFIAPSLTWSPTNDTSLTFSYKYNKEDIPFDRGTLAVRNSDNTGWEFLDIDENRLGGSFSEQNRETHEVGFDFSHDINNNWTTRLKSRYVRREIDAIQTFFYASSAVSQTTTPLSVTSSVTNYGEDGASVAFDGTINRYINGNDQSSDTILVSLENEITFDIRDTSHRIVTGIDYTTFKERVGSSTSATLSDPDLTTFSAATLGTDPNSGVYNFYTDDPSSLTFPNDLYDISNVKTELTEYSIFAQDLIEYNDWNFILGARYDWYKAKSRTAFDSTLVARASALGVNISDTSSEAPTDQNFSGQAAALYQLNDQVSLFGNIAQSYLPNEVFDDVNNEFEDAQRGTQYEVGAKLSLLDNRLNLTTSIYHINLKNVAFTNANGSVDVYNQRNRGFEVDGDFAISENLAALFAYGYNDVEFVDAPDDISRVANSPKHTATAFLAYEASRSWGVSGGVNYVATRAGNRRLAYDYDLPSYALVNASAWYVPAFADRDLRLQLDIKNLFDKDYIASASDSSQNALNLSSPITASLSATYQF